MSLPTPVEPGELALADAALADAALADAGADGRARRGEALVKLLLRSGRRAAFVGGGFGLLALGIALIPLPGPGLLVCIAGLALLAKEFVWAERLLHEAKARAARGADAARRLTRRRSP